MEFSGHQLLPIASCPISWHHWAEPGSMLRPPSLTDIDEVLSQLSLLEAAQAQFPQSFLIREMLHSLNHPCHPQPGYLQEFYCPHPLQDIYKNSIAFWRLVSTLMKKDPFLLHGTAWLMKTSQQTTHGRTGLSPTLSQQDDISITVTIQHYTDNR